MFPADTIAGWLDLPPVRIGAVDDRLTLADVLSQMTPVQRQAFDNGLALSDELYGRWSQLRSDFAALAHPNTKAWPDPDSADILEELFVGIAPVACLIYLTDGRRFVRDVQQSRLLTWAEFTFTYGQPVNQYLENQIAERTARYSRALELLKIETPHVVEASFVKDGAVFGKHLRVYDDSQVKVYARHQRLSLLTISP